VVKTNNALLDIFEASPIPAYILQKAFCYFFGHEFGSMRSFCAIIATYGTLTKNRVQPGRPVSKDLLSA
jgi:hypothetical protein